MFLLIRRKESTPPSPPDGQHLPVDERFRPILRHCGATLGSSWATLGHLGPISGDVGDVLGPLEAILKPSLGRLERPSCVILAPSAPCWNLLGTLLPLMAPSWPSWGRLGPSEGPLNERAAIHFGAILGYLGAILGDLGAFLGPNGGVSKIHARVAYC